MAENENLDYESNQNEAPNNGNPQDDDSQDKDRLLQRYKEQLNGSTEEAKRLKNLVLDSEQEKVNQDPNHLLAFYDRDPKLANDLAKRMNYNSFDEAKQSLVWSKQEDSGDDNDDLDSKLEKKLEEKEKKKEHQQAISEAKKKFENLSEEKKEAAEKYFNDITEWKVLDRNRANEFADMATLYVNKDEFKNDKLQENKSMYSTAWIWKTSPSVETERKEVLDAKTWKMIYLDVNK